MKRLPKGTKAQIMGTRLFQTMYTADQMRKVVANEREQCAKVCDELQPGLGRAAGECADAIRARGNT